MVGGWYAQAGLRRRTRDRGRPERAPGGSHRAARPPDEEGPLVHRAVRPVLRALVSTGPRQCRGPDRFRGRVRRGHVVERLDEIAPELHVAALRAQGREGDDDRGNQEAPNVAVPQYERAALVADRVA